MLGPFDIEKGNIHELGEVRVCPLCYTTVTDQFDIARTAVLYSTPYTDARFQAPGSLPMTDAVGSAELPQPSSPVEQEINPADLVRTYEINGGLLSWDQVANPASRVAE